MNTDKIIPSKRLRNWHRLLLLTSNDHPSLKAYARHLAGDATSGLSLDRNVVARAWMASKGMKP